MDLKSEIKKIDVTITFALIDTDGRKSEELVEKVTDFTKQLGLKLAKEGLLYGDNIQVRANTSGYRMKT